MMKEQNAACPVDSFRQFPMRQLGRNSLHHFFGYYDKTVWDKSGRYVLANQVNYRTANLTSDSSAQVGYFDILDNDEFHVCGETTAWNWQMGCQLQWLDGHDDPRFIYNVRRQTTTGPYPGFGAAIYDIRT